MATSPSPSSSIAGDSPAIVSWQLPVPRTAARTVGVGLALLFAAGFGILLGGKVVFGLLGPLLLLPVVTQYFRAPQYRLTGEVARAVWGLTVTEMRWSDVRRATRVGDQIHLSPLAGSDVRQEFRGVRLRLPAPPLRDEVIQAIRERVPGGLLEEG